MKEYKIGEIFTTDEVKTVRCVRSNGLCSGCVFLTNIYGVPRCKAMDIDCCERSREDGQHVIFEELEEHPEYPPFNPDREYRLFERFQYNGVVAECRDCAIYPCRDCAIYPCAVTYHNCMSFKRIDKVDVFYKKLGDVTEE